MPDMKVVLELIAKSEKFQQGMNAGEKALTGFRGHVGNVISHVTEATKRIGMLGQAATALSTGLVLKKLFSLADYMPIDDALLRMRVNLKATSAEMDAFKKKVASVAGETGLEQGQAFQAAHKLSFAFNQDDILQIMKVSDNTADAMKAPYDVVQDRIVQIMKLYRLTAKEAAGVGDALVASRVDVESLDTVMQRLVLRGGSKKDYTQTLGMIRGLGMAGMSNPRVIMQLNEVLGAIQDKGDILEASGIKVRKINADGTTEWRDQLEVLKDLEAYLQKWRKTLSTIKFDEQLAKVFGPNARQRLDFVFSQKENFKKGMEEMGRAAQIAAERSAAAGETWEKKLSQIKANLGSIKADMSFIYDLAKKPFAYLAESPEATKAAGYTAAGASLTVLGVLAAVKGREFFKGMGKLGGGIAAGKVLEETTGVTPVFVTNMPAGGLSAVPSAAKGGGFAQKLPFLAAGGALGAITAAIAGGSYLYLNKGGPDAYAKAKPYLNTGPAGMFTQGIFNLTALLSGYFDTHKQPMNTHKQPITEVPPAPAWIQPISTAPIAKVEPAWMRPVIAMQNPALPLATNKQPISTAPIAKVEPAWMRPVVTMQHPVLPAKETNAPLDLYTQPAKGFTAKEMMDDWFGSNLLKEFYPAEKQNIKNEIKLNLNIDRNGRVVTESSDSHTSIDVNLARGSFGY